MAAPQCKTVHMYKAELAPTGRARCKGPKCGELLPKDELRLAVLSCPSSNILDSAVDKYDLSGKNCAVDFADVDVDYWDQMGVMYVSPSVTFLRRAPLADPLTFVFLSRSRGND
jgi:hypothetical protein